MTGHQEGRGDCPVCGHEDAVVFLELPDVPVHCNILASSRAEARDAPTAEIRLASCPSCSHLFNLAFVAERMRYQDGYENSLFHSARFQAYAAEVVRHLVERYDVRAKAVLEIGSGDGRFLTDLCALGGNRGYGFDPGGSALEARAGAGGHVTLTREPFSPATLPEVPDLVCFRHLLEHLPDPVAFLRMVARVLPARSDAVVFCEVPNAVHMVGEGAVWDLLYEHVSYFGAASLAAALARAGLAVRSWSAEFGGQFLCMEASPGAAADSRLPTGAAARPSQDDLRRFARLYDEHAGAWSRVVEDRAQRGQRVVVWGAGTKGVMFVNALGSGAAIEHLVDLNPRKHGCFVPCTGQEVVPPEFLVDYRPDVVLVMNPIYRSEIAAHLARLGLRGTEIATV